MPEKKKLTREQMIIRGRAKLAYLIIENAEKNGRPNPFKLKSKKPDDKGDNSLKQE